MTLHFGMLLYPGLTQLDLTGPYEIMSRIPDTRVHLVARERAPVASDLGLAIVPNATYADAPPLDLIFAPGGSGQIAAMEDGATIDFIRAAGERARWVTSVCTGALLLGAAGLLRGYRAATHWAFMELLPLFGAEPVHERVVTDRNRITAGGVTAGIDFGLVLAAAIAGREVAESIQLGLEYDPAPPFTAGHPRVARRELVDRLRDGFRERYEQRRAQLAARSRQG
ncbi:MAG TPA: DJ-1/PfpI family protein [Kofleriaceae bacterium]|nr:DJ-1/PfpI family protein [Kofleriaceae bacterium]